MSTIYIKTLLCIETSMGKKRQFDEDEVLKIVADHFWKHGYSSTKVDQLSAITGLTKTSIYHAFGNKETLFLRAIDFYIEKDLSQHMKTIDLANSLSENIESLLSQIFLNDANEHLANGCFLTNSILELAGSDPLLHDEATKRFAKVQQSFLPIFDHYIENDLLKSDVSSTALTDFFMTFFQGLRVQSRNQTQPQALKNAISMFVGLIKTIEKENP